MERPEAGKIGSEDGEKMRSSEVGVRVSERKGMGHGAWGRESRVKSRLRVMCYGLRVGRYGCGISRTQRAKRIEHGVGELIWRMTIDEL